MPAPSDRRIPDIRIGRPSVAGFVQKVPARERFPLGRRNVFAYLLETEHARVRVNRQERT